MLPDGAVSVKVYISGAYGHDLLVTVDPGCVTVLPGCVVVATPSQISIGRCEFTDFMKSQREE